MANDQERGNAEDLRGQDPFVERRRRDPSQPPERVRILEGLLGDSDREGYKRLYFNRELDRYAEFRAEDVVFSERIPPDQPPFLALEATRVGIRWEATIEYTRVRTPRPVDEFDLDVRLEGPGLGARRRPLRGGDTRVCCTNDPGTGCLLTQGEATCVGTCDGTCDGTCGQFTCGGTCDGTCGGTCGQFTCGGTCGGTCGATCQTCQTRCFQHTCGDDDTCFRTCAARCPTGAFRCQTVDFGC